MPEAAAAAWIIFCAVCVVWRFWHQRKTTSDFGLRGIVPGRPGSAGWWGGAAIVASFTLLLAIPMLETIGLLQRTAAPGWQIATGVAVMAIGIVVTSAAQIGMGQSWRVGVRPGERTELVTTGIFGIVRNPIFSGVVLSGIGSAVLVPRAAMVAAALAALIGVEIQVRCVEEPHLRKLHGTDYNDYTRRVGRFLPGLGKTT
jgi:protein-S-isoprenylcysteine O-methyltransferase Ste14